MNLCILGVGIAQGHAEAASIANGAANMVNSSAACEIFKREF